MKHLYPAVSYVFFFMIIFLVSIPTMAETTLGDSLRILLEQTKDKQRRVEICVCLNNYCQSMHRKGYLQSTYLLLNEGIKAHNEYAISIALRNLVMTVERPKRLLTNDSIMRYLDIAEKHLTGMMKQSFITEVHLRYIRSVVDWTESEEEIISRLMAEYSAIKEHENDIFFQIEREYALGKVTALLISEDGRRTSLEAVRYFDNLLILLQKLPLVYRANLLFCMSDNFFVTYFSVDDKKKAVDFLEMLMSVLKEYEELLAKMNISQDYEDIYALYYEGMARCPELIGKEKATEYLEKFDEISRRPHGFMLSLFYAYKDYYRSIGDYKNAIQYGDSVIVAIQDSAYSETPGACAGIYREQAGYYANLKDYKNAYERFVKYDVINDSIVNGESKKLRQEMEVRYDFNRLELEKAQLVSKNRQIALISVLVILLLSIIWGVTQRLNLRKLQKMQKKLVESNNEVIRQSEKALESEKMKTAFINSMCHEIRTPLNSINGFCNLLLDESVDEEAKREFPGIISQGSNQLTQLLNDLLEISDLDSSKEELFTEPVDVRAICEQEMDKLKSIKNRPNIEYCLEIGEENSYIHTHVVYLTRVISNLLSNANKFTEHGKIALSCYKETEDLFVISITDTGIGIPADKREWVFERFTKIDEFKPGTGLGLYVCRLIMNRLGGTIHIDPEYTEGTRFILTLPS